MLEGELQASHGYGAALLDTAEAARALGLGKRTLANWRVLGGGPPFQRVGRAVPYDPNDLAAYLNARRFRSTAQADASQAAA